MVKKVIASKQFSISWRDTLNGLLISAGTAALFYVQSAVDKGDWTFNLKGVGMAALAGAVTYMTKKLTDPNKVVTIVQNTEKVDEAADKIKEAL